MRPSKDQIRGYFQAPDDETIIIAMRAYFTDYSYRGHPAYKRLSDDARMAVDAMTQNDAVERVGEWISDVEAQKDA